MIKFLKNTFLIFCLMVLLSKNVYTPVLVVEDSLSQPAKDICVLG